MHINFPSWKELNKKISTFEQTVAEKIGDLKADHPLAAAAINAVFTILPPPLDAIASNIYFSFDPSYPDRTDEVLKYIDQVRKGGEENYDKITSQLEKITGTLDVQTILENKNMLSKIAEILVSTGQATNQKLDDLTNDIKRLEGKVDEIKITAFEDLVIDRDTNKKATELLQQWNEMKQDLKQMIAQQKTSTVIIPDDQKEISESVMIELENKDKKIEILEAELEKLNQKPEFDVEDVDFLSKKANMYYLSGKYVKAIAICNLILAEDSDNVDALINKGAILVALAKYGEGLECFENALEIEPRNVGALNHMGLALGKLGRHQEALDCFEKALKIDPKNVYALNNKGFALSNLGMHQDALEWCKKALRIEPEFVIALNNKGRALSGLNRYEEALDCFEKALKIDPKYVLALHNKGSALHALGRYQEALDCYDETLEINPEYIYTYLNKGAALNILGRKQEALDCYEKALKIDPKNGLILRNKAVTLNILGKKEACLKVLDKMIKLGLASKESIITDPRFDNLIDNMHYLTENDEQVFDKIEICPFCSVITAFSKDGITTSIDHRCTANRDGGDLKNNFEDDENNVLSKYPPVEKMKKIIKTRPVYVNTTGNPDMIEPFSTMLLKLGFGKKQVIFENESVIDAKVGDYVAHPWPQGDALWLLIDKIHKVTTLGNNTHAFTYENVAKTQVL